jgi:hypothetical protein
MTNPRVYIKKELEKQAVELEKQSAKIRSFISQTRNKQFYYLVRIHGGAYAINKNLRIALSDAEKIYNKNRKKEDIYKGRYNVWVFLTFEHACLYVQGIAPISLFMDEGIENKLKKVFPKLADEEIKKLLLSVLIELPEKVWLPLSDYASSDD